MKATLNVEGQKLVSHSQRRYVLVEFNGLGKPWVSLRSDTASKILRAKRQVGHAALAYDTETVEQI